MNVYLKSYLIFIVIGVTINIVAQHRNLFDKQRTIDVANERHIYSRRNLLFFEDSLNSAGNSSGSALEVGDECLFDYDCNHGECKLIRTRTNPNGTWTCECDKGYVTHDRNIMFCNYKQRKQITAFLLSFFLGEFGADWFYIGNKNPTYDGLGVLKLFTLGGVGIWWIADFIRIAVSNCNFRDPSGVCLESW